MPPPPPCSLQKLALIVAVVTLAAGCGPVSNTPRPVPSVAQIGGDLKCTSGDHGFADLQAGWGFCYPGTWRYVEKSQGSQSPPGLDLTFDITETANGSTAGLFAFMIISTYDRRSVPNLAAWVQSNLTPAPASPASASPSPTPPPSLESISWGNASEAARLPDGRRIALTAHHVVIMQLNSGEGHLDLEAAMSARLGSWKFAY